MKSNSNKTFINSQRSGCKDIWNAFMCNDADFGNNGTDIPYCPNTVTLLPNKIITWTKAKEIYSKNIQRKYYDFKYDAFVCWYVDDYKFDGPRGIWHDYNHALKVLKHFAGAITPDFSTYQDFPDPIKRYNTYRMRVYGIWLSKNGIPVINNVRWGTSETYQYCFEGIPENSVVAIGTVGGSPRKLKDRKRFELGLYEMVKVCLCQVETKKILELFEEPMSRRDYPCGSSWLFFIRSNATCAALSRTSSSSGSYRFG